MAKVIWTDRALRQIEEIGDYIAKKNPKAAVAVLEELIAAPAVLGDHPRAGWREEAIIDRELRCLLYGHYRLMYEVVDEQAVKIVAVLHASRDLSDYEF